MQINKFINKKKGLPSFCTSNVDVLKTIFFFCQTNKFPCLIESTSNQVNQFGGYTNKTPRMFYKEISILSKKFNLKKNLFLGGDHLGPLPFKNQNSNKAIINSIRLINNYLKSDFCKIHIDTSIKCKNDREINQKIIFERTKKILTKINLKKKIKMKKNKNKYLLTVKDDFQKQFKIKIDYLELRNINNLKLSNVVNTSRLFVAYYLNGVRLIDNL